MATATTSDFNVADGFENSFRHELEVPFLKKYRVYLFMLGFSLFVGLAFITANLDLASYEEDDLDRAFLGSGLIDALIKYFEEVHLAEEELPIFSAVVFGAAALTGILFIGVNTFKKPLKVNPKNVVGGIALGIPNYFSIFFLFSVRSPFRRISICRLWIGITSAYWLCFVL